MGRKRLLCRNFLRNYTCLFLLISLCASCDKAVFLESSNEKTSSARLGAEALFSTSYEIEEFTAVQILSKLADNSKQRPFLEIAAQPRLNRQSVDFKLFADGNYEIVTTQLDPTRLELLPSFLRNKKPESVLSYKSVVSNGIAHFYDKNGKETGQTQLKLTKFSTLAEKILRSAQTNESQIANEIMGHPLINEAYVLGLAKEKNALVKQQGRVTQIKFDLMQFALETNDNAENLDKYSVQFYDFKKKRLLGESLYDKNGDKLLFRSTSFYTPEQEGNQVEKVFSETFHEDPKTGVKSRTIKQTYYNNVKASIKI